MNMRGVGRLLALAMLWLGLVAAMPARAADDYLDPDQAFQLSVRALNDREVELTYHIAPGYYLYRERFKFDAEGATLAAPKIPPGKVKYDPQLEQKVETYHDEVVVTLGFTQAPGSFVLHATHQGCAEKGLCYPPQPRTLQVSLKGFGAAESWVRVLKDGDGAAAVASAAPVASAGADALKASMTAGSGSTNASVAPATAAPAATDPVATPAGTSDEGRLQQTLKQGRLVVIIPAFFLAGLLLSLTPCVLPMVPILSSIIVGQGAGVTRSRGFALAFSYALGMALLYTVLGVAAGLIGEGLAAALQKPWVLALFAALLALLSLSMFGLYELQLPEGLRNRLSSKNDGLSGGQFAGVFLMGGLSALIVSPCVAAPLAGALLYISQTRDAVLGGLALFTLAMGMSVPLLAVGASAGHLLPRSGAWMDQVKHVFGLLLLAVALYLLGPVLPPVVAMGLWGTLLLVGATSLHAFEPVHPGPHVGGARLMKGFGLVLALLGVLQFVGAASGGRNPLQPLGHLALGEARAANLPAAEALPFKPVASVEALDAVLAQAGRPVMLDFYADWCVSCKEMEAQTFTDARVRARLAGAVLLRADVTANSEADRALLKRFKLFGPPGLIFFDAKGQELASARVVGFQSPEDFLVSLKGAGL